jgi:chitinase
MEMQSYAGIPLDKIVIGKPINAGAAANGYVALITPIRS